jgi:peptidyl-dipeptidase A
MKSILLAGSAMCAGLLTIAATTTPTPGDARAFVAAAEKKYAEFNEYGSRIAWVNANFITDDTDWLAAKVGAEGTELGVQYAKQAAQYDGIAVDADTRRKLNVLKSGLTLPAPSTAGAAQELNDIATRLNSAYGKGKGTYKGVAMSGNDLEEKMGTERDPALLKEMWESWHDVGKPMKADYARMVEIANAGSKELGYPDTGAMWRSNYDMSPDEFARLTDKLWGQMKPLYDELHCNVRMKLNKKHGDAVQAKTGPIRADLLGNMWAQEWGDIYDIAGAKTSAPTYNLTSLLEEKKYTPLKMVQISDGFFQSLGFEKMPQTFWDRSLLTKPADREVACHASAWDIDSKDDIRIKMCTKVNGGDFVTVHHEMGHNIYQRAYKNQPTLFQNSANDGFHEAVGDFIALSVTPDYLVKIGLLDEKSVPAPAADNALLMKQAMDKIAFLPFGLLVDKWRWQVFSGELKPDQYNAGWWNLRTQYQGIVPPGPRPADAFDPGAKYHIPGNTPYARYFLARILQFQFHEAACKMANWQGPLHRCSIYGNKEVGKRIDAMLAMGSSKPWPDALEAFTGSREMDAGAVVRYFKPLMVELKKENEGQKCGW